MLSVSTPTNISRYNVSSVTSPKFGMDQLLPPLQFGYATPVSKTKKNYPDRFIPPRENVFPADDSEDMIPSPAAQTPRRLLNFDVSDKSSRNSVSPRAEAKKRPAIDKEPTEEFIVPGLVHRFGCRPLSFSKYRRILLAINDAVSFWDPFTSSEEECPELDVDSTPLVVQCGMTRGCLSNGAFGLENGCIGYLDLEEFACTFYKPFCINNILDIDVPQPFHILSCSGRSIFWTDTRQDRTGLISADYGRAPDHPGFTTVKMFPDLTTVIVGCRNGNIYLVDLRKYSLPYAQFNAHVKSMISRIDFCPWNTDIVSSSGYEDKTVLLWDLNTQLKKKEIKTTYKITDMAWSLSHQQFVTTHWNSSIQAQLFEYPSYEQTAKFSGHGRRVVSCATSPKGSRVALATTGQRVQMWQCWKDEAKKSPMRHPRSPLRMCVR